MSQRKVSTSRKQAFDKIQVSRSAAAADAGLHMVELPEGGSHVTTRADIRNRRKFNQILQGYVLTDVLGFTLGFILAWNLTQMVSALFFGTAMLDGALEYDSFRVVSYGVIAAGCLMWFQHKGHYRVRVNFWQEMKNIICTLCVAMMVNGFFQFATKHDFSRVWLMSGWVFAAVSIVLFRGLYRIGLRQQGLWSVPTLLVGGGATAEDTRQVLENEKSLGYVITAQITDLPSAFMRAGRSWEKLCQMYEVDYVMIALDGREMDDAEKPVAQLMRENVPFSVSPPRRHLPVLDMVPQYFFNSDVKLLTHNSGLEQPMPRFVKRLFDIAVSGGALIAVSPLMLVLAYLTKRDGGPVFFGHQRIGKDGKTFPCLKFRSMIVNSKEVLEKHLAENAEARAEWDADQKLKNDPRITRFGNFLRSSSLDELPQLINVLRGEMSLVGPRPIVTAEVSKYDHDIAHYYRVSPGITGLWQVSGRNDVSYTQRVQMDSWYVRNWSLWHDIAILCKTLPALCKRSGAY